MVPFAKDREGRIRKKEEAGLEGGGVSTTYRVKGTTPAAAVDWTKSPQLVPLLSDQEEAGLGAGLAPVDIRSDFLSLPVSCHCNPSEYNCYFQSGQEVFS